ncbi:class I SAM-dependent methyltransferase [Frateuria aurantia]
MPVDNSIQRFDQRVEDYQRYRPDYPPALLDWLRQRFGLSPHWQVADIGAGTGISSQMLLQAGLQVTAVEPNAPMREAALRWLGDNPRFRVVDGRADASTLPTASIDLISVAQAFHWFDPVTTHREFARLLRPGGIAAIYWNTRRLDGSPFLVGYEDLLQRYGTDYLEVRDQHADGPTMRQWFGGGFRDEAHFPHAQALDFDGLRGRLMSSSYAPRAGHPNHEPMLAALREVFEACAEEGHIDFEYDTRIYVGEVC